MSAKRIGWGLALSAVLLLGPARLASAQGLGGFGGNAGFNAIGGLNQFPGAPFANPGFGVGGFGAVSNFSNNGGLGYSPYGLSGGSPYAYGYQPGVSNYGYGYNPYTYGYSPYGYNYSPYSYGGYVASPIYTAPPIMMNQTNSLMGVIRSNTGRGNWRAGGR
jgi:hypothetical protein